MKQRTTKKILMMCVLSIAMLFLTACFAKKDDPTRFDVSLKCGYGNSVEIGCYAPFYVEVTNNREDFEGTIQLIVPGRENHNVMYEKELSIPAGATKTVELVGFIDVRTRQVNVRIADDGDVIWSELQNCVTLADLRNVNVGVLSDDYAALGYMDHKPFREYQELTTQIFELKQSTFPSDWRALDMLDVIVISDFSTDMLSDEQLNALSLWVNDGGLLMVGTGSTSSKTLAKLNGTLFHVAIGDLKEYDTKFGLTLADFNYDYVGGNNYSSPYSDSLYESFYEQNYEMIREELEEMYMTEFQNDYGFISGYDTWDEYWEDSFYWYCFDEFYEYYLESIGSGNGSAASEISQLSYVRADVLQLTGDCLDNPKNCLFEGDIRSGSDTYDLAYGMRQGDGYVLLSCVDFTKTPLSNYDGNSMMFIHWVETLIGNRCYEEAMNYSDYSYGYYDLYDMDYDEEMIFYGASSATIPPTLIYLGVIVLYLIAILVIYLVLHHKKKTMNLWIVYPAVAAGLAILIFCIGFSTRIYRPVLNTTTLITPNGSTWTETSYTGVTVPGNKGYEIGFAPEQAVEYYNLDYSYYYDDSEEIDFDSYDIGYRYGYESVDVSLGEMEAMGTAYFMMNAVVPTERNIRFETTGSVHNMVITNDFGCDLEHAAIIYNGDLYEIGDFKAGESVKFSALNRNVDFGLYSEGLGDIMMRDEHAKIILGLIFGSTSSIYDEYLRELRAYNSMTDYVSYYSYYGSSYQDDPDFVFVGIPTESVAQELQGSTNYNERRVEVIHIEYTIANSLNGSN